MSVSLFMAGVFLWLSGYLDWFYSSDTEQLTVLYLFLVHSSTHLVYQHNIALTFVAFTLRLEAR